MIVRLSCRLVLVLLTALPFQMAAAQPSISDAMNNIFTLAESKLGEYFPAGAQTQIFENYVYRYYEATGTYLAFADDNVLVLGGIFGNSPVSVGSLLSVESALDAYQAQVADAELWNMRVTGTISFFGQNTPIPEIIQEGVPAPDISDVDAVTDAMLQAVEGILADVTDVTIVVVSNTDTQRIADISFNAAAGGFVAGYELRLTFTR